LLSCLPFSPDWATNVFPSRRLTVGAALGDAVAPIALRTAFAPVAVTKIRAIATDANEVVGRRAVIFGLSVRENHPCY